MYGTSPSMNCARRWRGAISWWLLAAALSVQAQDQARVPAPAVAGAESAVASEPALRCGDGMLASLQGCEGGEFDDRRKFRTRALLFGSVGATAAYGRAKWWQDGFTGKFKSRNEGWFGGGTEYGGADKLGHAMFAYSGARLLAHAYQWAGNEPQAALRLGVATAVGTMMGVEVLDAFARKWHFSHEDAVANLAGGALAWWLESDPAADALLDFRIQYARSTGPDGRRAFDPFGDYSGQRYLMVAKASGMPALREHPWLRYLEFNVGYGTRNFETESRALTAPTRHVYYGVALNLSELLRSTVYQGSARPSRTQRFTETLFEFVQLPAATTGGERVLR